MRVLMTTDTVGGVWTFSKELAAGLLQSGHAVALVSLGRAPSHEQLTCCSRLREEYGDRFLFESSCAPLEWMNANDTAYADAEPLLLRVADRFVPDLLHSNQFCFGCLPVDLPKIITAHSDVFSWAAACRPEGLEPSPWLDRYRSLVETGLGGADVVVAPTHSMLHALGEHFSVLPPSYVILNGRSLPAVSEEEPRALQAVSVGRLWDEAKNLAILNELQASFPIFAVGEQRYEDAKAPEHSGCFDLIGPLAEKELLRLFRQSSVYLVTSIYEPFGLAPLEAALCGCAVVANDISSLREVWGEGALYFQGPAGMTQLLQMLRASPDVLQVARQRSYERALQLSAGRMTEAYVALYEELLGSKRPLPMQELNSIAC
jgi:glycogen(starch) synthase